MRTNLCAECFQCFAFHFQKNLKEKKKHAEANDADRHILTTKHVLFYNASHEIEIGHTESIIDGNNNSKNGTTLSIHQKQ